MSELSAPTTDVDGRLDLERLIGQLPAGCRSVLVLHDIEGFTHDEIAATLGIAAGTSKAHATVPSTTREPVARVAVEINVPPPGKSEVWF